MRNNKEIPSIPIYVDSPLAGNITSVFGEHPEEYDRETHQTFLERGMNPFMFPGIEYISSVEESMNLMREEKPHIVISASGMCESGRILHHLRCKVHDEKNTILIVGYMAQNTLGRKILEEGSLYAKNGRKGAAPVLKILNKEYPLKARVIKLGGFSAHADQKELVSFLEKSNLNIKKIAVVHGEEDQSLAFAELLKELGYEAFVPKSGERYSVYD
jgi:metallo-beta-lactamase family protein